MARSTTVITCAQCEQEAFHMAKGLCRKCYQNGWRKTRTPKPTQVPEPVADTRCWPARQEIIVWECSDGREFSAELEAAYHQLNIYKSVAMERR